MSGIENDNSIRQGPKEPNEGPSHVDEKPLDQELRELQEKVWKEFVSRNKNLLTMEEKFLEDLKPLRAHSFKKGIESFKNTLKSGPTPPWDELYNTVCELIKVSDELIVILNKIDTINNTKEATDYRDFGALKKVYEEFQHFFKESYTPTIVPVMFCCSTFKEQFKDTLMGDFEDLVIKPLQHLHKYPLCCKDISKLEGTKKLSKKLKNAGKLLEETIVQPKEIQQETDKTNQIDAAVTKAKLIVKEWEDIGTKIKDMHGKDSQVSKACAEVGKDMARLGRHERFKDFIGRVIEGRSKITTFRGDKYETLVSLQTIIQKKSYRSEEEHKELEHDFKKFMFVVLQRNFFLGGAKDKTSSGQRAKKLLNDEFKDLRDYIFHAPINRLEASENRLEDGDIRKLLEKKPINLEYGDIRKLLVKEPIDKEDLKIKDEAVQNEARKEYFSSPHKKAVFSFFKPIPKNGENSGAQLKRVEGLVSSYKGGKYQNDDKQPNEAKLEDVTYKPS